MPNALTAVELVADRIIQSVCSLDPSDYPVVHPDTLFVSDHDLRIIVERHVTAALAAARREVEAARAALERFGHHADDCLTWRNHKDTFGGLPCNCGLAAALAATPEVSEPKPPWTTLGPDDAYDLNSNRNHVYKPNEEG